MAMDLIDANSPDPVPQRQARPMPRIAGPSPETLPTEGLRTIYPEQVPRLAAPSQAPQLGAPESIRSLAAQATEAPAAPSGPLARAASIATRMAPAAGAAGLLAGGVAATGLAGGTVAANPDYFKSSIGDDGLAANIMSAAQPPTIADVAKQAPTTARTQSGPLNIPMIAQQPPRGSEQRFPPAPQYDEANRATTMTDMQNQAARESDPIGQAIQQKMGDQGAAPQPPAGGDAGQPPAGGKPIMFATYGGGADSSKAYYADGSTQDLQKGQPLPADVQAFNQQSAQAGMDSQQPVQVIRALSSTMATPNPTANQAAGYMQEVPMSVADAGQNAVANFQSAQAQDAINRADPTAAGVRAKVAETTLTPGAASNGASAAGAAGASPAAQLAGDDYLKTLDPKYAAQVKSLLGYQMPITPMMLKQPLYQKMLSDAIQTDPSFDVTKYPARQKLQNDVAAGGAIAKTNNSINTAIGHLSDLSDVVDNLHTTSGYPGATFVNKQINNYLHSKGDTDVEAFGNIREKVAGELEKAFKGSPGTLSEVSEAISHLDPSLTKDQLKRNLMDSVKLLHSKIEANAAQFNQGMGKPADNDPGFVTSQSKASIGKIFKAAGKPNPFPDAVTSAPAQSAPAAAPSAPAAAPSPYRQEDLAAEMKRRGLLK